MLPTPPKQGFRQRLPVAPRPRPADQRARFPRNRNHAGQNVRPRLLPWLGRGGSFCRHWPVRNKQCCYTPKQYQCDCSQQLDIEASLHLLFSGLPNSLPIVPSCQSADKCFVNRRIRTIDGKCELLPGFSHAGPGEMGLSLGSGQENCHFLTIMIKLFRDHSKVDAFFIQPLADASQCAVDCGDALFHRQLEIEYRVFAPACREP